MDGAQPVELPIAGVVDAAARKFSEFMLRQGLYGNSVKLEDAMSRAKSMLSHLQAKASSLAEGKRVSRAILPVTAHHGSTSAPSTRDAVLSLKLEPGQDESEINASPDDRVVTPPFEPASHSPHERFSSEDTQDTLDLSVSFDGPPMLTEYTTSGAAHKHSDTKQPAAPANLTRTLSGTAVPSAVHLVKLNLATDSGTLNSGDGEALNKVLDQDLDRRNYFHNDMRDSSSRPRGTSGSSSSSHDGKENATKSRRSSKQHGSRNNNSNSSSNNNNAATSNGDFPSLVLPRSPSSQRKREKPSAGALHTDAHTSPKPTITPASKASTRSSADNTLEGVWRRRTTPSVQSDNLIAKMSFPQHVLKLFKFFSSHMFRLRWVPSKKRNGHVEFRFMSSATVPLHLGFRWTPDNQEYAYEPVIFKSSTQHKSPPRVWDLLSDVVASQSPGMTPVKHSPSRHTPLRSGKKSSVTPSPGKRRAGSSKGTPNTPPSTVQRSRNRLRAGSTSSSPAKSSPYRKLGTGPLCRIVDLVKFEAASHNLRQQCAKLSSSMRKLRLQLFCSANSGDVVQRKLEYKLWRWNDVILCRVTVEEQQLGPGGQCYWTKIGTAQEVFESC